MPKGQNDKRTFYRNLALSLLVTLCTILITIFVTNFFQKQLEAMATRDKLTNAFNRNEFERRYGYLAAMTKRNMLKLSVVMIDVDNFKTINDTYGHVFGDMVLKSLADIANSITRENDVLVRWGGDEFILLSIGDIEHAKTIGERLLEMVRVHDFYEKKAIHREHKIDITISCGVAPHLPDDNLDKLVTRADKALYTAKENGRDQMASYKKES